MKPIYSSGKSQHPGFTLIELLAVIAVIAILAAMLLPALGQRVYVPGAVLCFV